MRESNVPGGSRHASRNTATISARLLLAALYACALAVPCRAAEPEEDGVLTANVSLVSQYVSRGVRQSWGGPALQAGLDYSRTDGWSAGTWTSTVSSRFVERAKVEWDLYGGYGCSEGPVAYSVMVYYYKYPGAVISNTGTHYDYGELSAGLGAGPAYAKYNYTFTRDFFGIEHARGTGYLDIGANPELGGGYTLNLHAGSAHVAGAGNGVWNWRDIKAGVSKSLDGGWSASLAYTRAWGATDVYKHYTTGVPGASGQPSLSDVARGTVVFGLMRTF